MPMYNEYFGLKETPFSIAPDPRYLYMSGQHREALAHLLYGIRSEGGFVLLTGEVGTGKTTVCRCLLEQMPENCDVAFIFNPKLTVKELLSTICDELHIKYPQATKSIIVFIDLINAYLLEAHAKGRRAVLIIDEAQNLSRDVLEQIRLLTNLETNQRKLLQIILLGQPELQQMLSQPKLRQLSQRIIARYHLGPLTQEEVGAYVRHRLSVAGLRGQLFAGSALRELYRLSGGIPRVINMLCDRALLGTYAQGRHDVARSTLRRAAREVLGEVRQQDTSTEASLHRSLLAGLVSISATLLLVATHYDRGQSPSIVTAAAVVEAVDKGRAEHRMPIPPETKPPAQDQAPPNPANPGKIPWPMIEHAMLEDHKTPDAERAPTVTENPPKPQDQEITRNPSQDPAPQSLFHGFSEGVRHRSRSMARLALLKLWEIDSVPGNYRELCQQAESRGLRCLRAQGNVDELRALNVPAILKLLDPQGKPFYVTLKSLRGHKAILCLGDEFATVSVDEIASLWKGEYTLLWRPPPEFSGNIHEGDQGAAVKWLDARLRVVQGKGVEALKDPVFDSLLVEEVRRYQLSKGLKADGVVGPKTLILLGADTSSKMPLLTGKSGDD